MHLSTNYNCENESVYELITSLCNKTASKYCDHRISQKKISSKMKTLSYEIILKKSSSNISMSNIDPLVQLSSLCFTMHNSAKNVSEFKRSVKLKQLINTIRNIDFDYNRDFINKVIRFLNALRDSEKQDISNELFQNPFSFGLLDEMLPKPKREVFGSSQPYSYFPSHVFELPFSLKRQDSVLDKQRSSQCYVEYTVDSFDSKSYFYRTSQNGIEIKTFLSPMSLESDTSSNISPYSDNIMFNCPRLMAPRDLQVPSSLSSGTNAKESVASTNTDIQEVYRAEVEDNMDVWDIVTKLDENVPEDIWDYVSKLDVINERQIIATSSRETLLWRQTYSGQMLDLNVISEKMFIRHIMYLIIGIEISTFPFSEESNCFYMKDSIALEGVSMEQLRGYVAPLLEVGTYYKRLYSFAFSTTIDDEILSKGLIYEAAREVIRRYLLDFRLKITELFEDTCYSKPAESNFMPTLLQILHHMEPFKYEIETIASIYKLSGTDSTSTIPCGAELMSYLFSEISLVTHKITALTLYNSLFSICKVYFKFIERFIFEGELDDPYKEFFIRKDGQYVNSRSKRYWDKGFHIVTNVAIPDFLRPLASFILLCGKSLRLLKLCNPGDPLIVLLSTAHPSVRPCPRWAELERTRRLLDVYRTRCLFVAGEPASLHRLLLRRDAERKAFAEMASLKQAETMEKIVAERKRLAQLIIAEKQHSLKVLEAAMAEAKAAKNKAKQRERKLSKMETAADAAAEEVDSKLKDSESNKIMEYYSKLNMEVEKSKKHTEWKIKRLQLDESRMQMLSTEERNLKREKLELEHQRTDDVMAMSTQSIDMRSENELEDAKNQDDNAEYSKVSCPVKGVEYLNNTEQLYFNDNFAYKCSNISHANAENNRARSQSSNDVFSAICNVAKSIFGVGKSMERCDNEVEIDNEGNIIEAQPESNVNIGPYEVSNENNIKNSNIKLQYLERKKQALQNKQKVMTHELGDTDYENNQIKSTISFTIKPSLDEENNLEWWSYGDAKKNIFKASSVESVKSNANKEKDIVITPMNIAKQEALLNREKVLGVEYNLPHENVKAKVSTTVAQIEAVSNRQKVLGVEYNLPVECIVVKQPVNVAQKEAIWNRKKVLGVEFNLPLEDAIVKEPANIAQEEAVSNRNKILSVKYNLPLEDIGVKEPANIAQEEALSNRKKNLGVKYNLPLEDVVVKEPVNIAQEEAVINRNKILGVEYNLPPEDTIVKDPVNIAQEEAASNRKKHLGMEFNLPIENKISKEPVNIAQEEALANRIKVLGVKYNLPMEYNLPKEPANVAQIEALCNKSNSILGLKYNVPVDNTLKDPVNVAQEEALCNKIKALGSEFEMGTARRHDSTKKLNLKLNLKPHNEASPKNTCVTPNTGGLTPGELVTGTMRLDLETPTTADMPLDSAITGDVLTPKSEFNKDFETNNSHKEYLSTDGFNFSLMVDEDSIDSGVNDIPFETSLENSPSKIQDTAYAHKSIFNILDGSYNLDTFDPFGIKQLHNYEKDYFNNKINVDMNNSSFYTHPSIIMENVRKRPYSNIFASRFDQDGVDEEKITCDNIVTLTACLQRSVMLPLTYQLEVVNNSILTYFLINLDMYEHLKSLKDYFFLMDGEFSRSICHNLFSKLTKTLNPQELLNYATLHNILDKALGCSILNIHKFSENLSFTISDAPLSFQHSSPDVLQSLSLSYSVGWPLNIILSQEALVRYTKVFQFLIKMRRISWVLSEDFENLKLSVKLLKPYSRRLLRSPQYISIQLYRHIMSSLIRALDNYIVTTCIVNSWTEFETDLKKARTLDDLYDCHVVYIKKVLFRCLLNNRSTPIMKLLNDIFTVILKFSRVLKAGDWHQKETNGCYSHTNFPQLEELFHLFEKLAKYLHKVVIKLMECGYQRHLVELLTMVNLNGYYSETPKEDTNASIQST